MNSRHLPHGLFACLLLLLLLSPSAFTQTTSRISSAFLARGEQAYLEVSVSGGDPDEVPQIPQIKNLTVKPLGSTPQTRIGAGRSLEYLFQYIVTSYEVGKITIPPIEISVSGIKQVTQPIDLQIFNPDDLTWKEIASGDRLIRYASLFCARQNQPFENQTSPTELKLYIPEDLVVDDWGIPDFQRDGLTAWRFQPAPIRSMVNLLGMRYVGVSYPSTITPTRPGPVSIGPAKVRLITRETVLTPYPRQVNKEIFLAVPELELESQPLPSEAPDGFANAVGDFTLSATTANAEIQEGDPIAVDLVVSGSGNLDTLRPPEMADTDGWKIYGTNTEQRGDERRLLTGTVVFHQSIRPLMLKTAIPPFRLVYFDPTEKLYKTLTSPPIPLKMIPSKSAISAAGPPTAAQIPVEAMTDILENLRPSQLTIPSSFSLPERLWHSLAAALACLLLGKAFWKHYGPRFSKNPLEKERILELRRIEARSDNDLELLGDAGRYIERWFSNKENPELQAIVSERDAVVFCPEKNSNILTVQRRSEILRILRKSAVLLICLLVLGSNSVQAADLGQRAQEAYDTAKYDEALTLWLSAGSYETLSPDTLYNIGNACYRSGSPGDAALYYRRALIKSPDHPEALQNLRFIERKYGSITVDYAPFQGQIALIPLSGWRAGMWTCAWLTVIALLTFPATSLQSRLRPLAVITLGLAPLFASLSWLGYYYYPDDAKFAEVTQQAVIIAPDVSLYTDAARTSPKVTQAPPGSLCEVISISGRWAYVAFSTKSRGWILVESIEFIVPRSQPIAPKFRKPVVDGKSA
jgi:tetratricopeptide (TPR) repeat protein